jgi:hypothetical protein
MEDGASRGSLTPSPAPEPKQADPLFSLLRINAVMGAVLGALFTGGLIWFDAAKIATMASRQGIEPLAYTLLFVAFAALGAGVMVASAIMMQRPDDGASGKGGRREPVRPAAPVGLTPAPVRSAAKRGDPRQRMRG